MTRNRKWTLLQLEKGGDKRADLLQILGVDDIMLVGECCYDHNNNTLLVFTVNESLNLFRKDPKFETPPPSPKRDHFELLILLVRHNIQQSGLVQKVKR